MEAETDDKLAVCQKMEQEYSAKYGKQSVLQTLYDKGDFKGFLDVYECYKNSVTSEDVKNCGHITEQPISLQSV